MSSTHTDEKVQVESQHEAQQGTTLVMPAELAALTPEEYEKLGKKATWKVDALVMPGVCIFYHIVHTFLY